MDSFGGKDTKSVFPISAFAQKSGLELSLTKKLGLISDRSKSDDLIYQVFFACVSKNGVSERIAKHDHKFASNSESA